MHVAIKINRLESLYVVLDEEKGRLCSLKQELQEISQNNVDNPLFDHARMRKIINKIDNMLEGIKFRRDYLGKLSEDFEQVSRKIYEELEEMKKLLY